MKTDNLARRLTMAPAAVLVLLAAAPCPAAERSVDETRSVSATGSVEVVNVAGSIEVRGWDKAELKVTGSLGEHVERLNITTSGDHATVRVVVPSGMNWGSGDSSADITVMVPKGSSLKVSAVSADLTLGGVTGRAELQTVSGEIGGETLGDAAINAVSGDVRLTSQGARHYSVRTVSGDIRLSGAAGDVDVNTVSGDAQLELGPLSRARFESVSGDLGIDAGFSEGASVDAETVSGDFTLNLTAEPGAAIDLQTLSGDITSCFGPAPVRPEYGPGSRLTFSSGNGKGRIHAETKSGDIRLCTRPRQARL